MQHFLSNYWQYFIEGVITILVIGLQVIYYTKTKKRIKELENIFPAGSFNNSNIELDDTNPGLLQKIKINKSACSYLFSDMVESINKYLEKNHGVVDFTIIKSIVDRAVESEEEDVSANVSLPLYIGLMGTFLGIVIGLVKIAFFGGVTGPNIDSFLGGVFIAMIASFVGLLLTVVNNSGNYKKAKKDNDSKKNLFFNFLENELLPYSGNSINEVLERFKNNIGDFNVKFGKNINLFDEKFSDNIRSLKESVNEFTENIDPIIENTTDQKELLKELRSIDFKKIVESNLELFKVMDQAVPNFLLFIQKQSELNNAIDKSIQSVLIIDTILNRVKRFEESINGLGDRIDNASYMESDLLSKVNRKLTELDNQFELLKQHSQLTSGQIEHHFSQEKEKITILSLRVLSELQEALNFNIGKNPLKKLEMLESIEEILKEWRQNIISLKDFIPVSSDINSSKIYINGINDNIVKLIKMKDKSETTGIINSETHENGKDEATDPPPRPWWKRLFGGLKNRNGK